MTETLLPLLLALLILALASFVQGTIGFASGLIAIPLLVLAGFTLPEAIMMNLIASAGQNVLGAWRLRREIPFDRVWRPVVLRTLALPLGVALLWFADTFPPEQVKQVVGAVLLVLVVAQAAARFEPREEIPRGWDWVAFGLGGLMLGFCGMGGPPLVLWVLAHRWPPARARAFLFFLFASGMVPHFLLLLALFGAAVLPAALLGLAAMPAVLAATHVGLQLGGRLPARRLRLATYFTLVLIALSAVFSPWL